MTTISLQDIERDPLGYLHRVEEGESFILYRDGQPFAEIKPVSVSHIVRPFGLCSGEFEVPADFDGPLPESILEEFEGT